MTKIVMLATLSTILAVANAGEDDFFVFEIRNECKRTEFEISDAKLHFGKWIPRYGFKEIGSPNGKTFAAGATDYVSCSGRYLNPIGVKGVFQFKDKVSDKKFTEVDFENNGYGWPKITIENFPDSPVSCILKGAKEKYELDISKVQRPTIICSDK